MSLFRVLYRQLLRLARQHDRHPTLKAMLEHPRRQWLLTSASAPLPAGARPLRVLPSPSGSGIILTGSLRSLQGPQLEKILRKLVRGEPMGEGAEEGEGEGEEGAEGEAESVDQAWARTVSPAQARWIHDFFRDADFYLPTALMESIVRREFRMPLPEASSASATATGSAAARHHSAGSATAAAASSAAQPAHPTRSAHTAAASRAHSHGHSASHPVDPRTQLTTEAFGVLRTLNKNVHDGAAKKALFREEDVVADPAFADPSVAPQDQPRPASLDTAQPAPASEAGADQGRESARSAPIEAVSVSSAMVMRPATSVSVGTFLVAHPHLESSPFDRTVILLYKVSREEGAAGVVLNRPFISAPNTLGDKMKRLRSTDPLRLLRPCAMHDGGPVSGSSVGFGGLYRGGSGGLDDVGGVTLFHRHPVLAHLSETVISGDYPVWRLPVEAVPQAAATLAEHVRLAEIAVVAARDGAAGATLDGGAAAAAALATPLSESAFLSSDLIAYAGRAEWFPGQLESEVQRGSWVLSEGSGAHVFMRDPAAEAEAEERERREGADAKRRRKRMATMQVAPSSSAQAAPAGAGGEGESASDGAAADASGDASASAPADSSWTSMVNGMLVPHRPLRAFPLPHLWSHAMHVHGGEFRHWAHWTQKPDEASKDALLNELLSGRE